MKRAALLVSVALAAGGCAEEELERAPRPLAPVQLAARDPGPGCRIVEAVEVRSGRDDEPSSEALRAYAADRGANYVVVDTFSVYDEGDDASVLTRARLFACPLPRFAE